MARDYWITVRDQADYYMRPGPGSGPLERRVYAKMSSTEVAGEGVIKLQIGLEREIVLTPEEAADVADTLASAARSAQDPSTPLPDAGRIKLQSETSPLFIPDHARGIWCV
jgi:hypothetical protein